MQKHIQSVGKRGFFSKISVGSQGLEKFTFENMMCFQKDPIPTSMLRINGYLVSRATKLFRIILKYMGVDSSDRLISTSLEERIELLGPVWTAIAHIIIGVIGSGVLSLAWSVARLGWIAGPMGIIIFGIISIISSFLLCDCYRYPDLEVGHIRNRTYTQAVKSNLGKKGMWICEIFVQESYFGYGIAYTITSAISMRAILRSNCFHKNGHNAPCEFKDNSYMLLFGAIQILFSQIPNFHEMEWLSVIAAIMSFAYTFIGMALGFAKVIGDGKIKGDISGVRATNAAEKVWLTSQAVGDIAFAYTYNVILLEIQDTLKAPPPQNQTMKKASTVAIVLTTFFFLCCGCFGYAAFGNQAPGNILTGFGFYEPYWLVDFANACIVLHLVGGYQVYSQPLFAAAERWIAKKLPDNEFVNKNYTLKPPLLPQLQLNVLRLSFRTAYVASTTALAMLFPYFNQVLGVLGALNFWPLAIYFPVEMYLVQNSIRAWTGKWIILQAFKLLCLVCTIFAFIGSLEGLINSKLS